MFSYIRLNLPTSNGHILHENKERRVAYIHVQRCSCPSMGSQHKHIVQTSLRTSMCSRDISTSMCKKKRGQWPRLGGITKLLLLVLTSSLEVFAHTHTDDIYVLRWLSTGIR